MMPFVRGVMRRSICSGSMFIVRGSESTRTGRRATVVHRICGSDVGQGGDQHIVAGLNAESE